MTYDAQQRRRTVSPPFFAEALLLNLFMKTFTRRHRSRSRIAGLVSAELATLCALGVLPALPIGYAGSRLIAHRLYGVGVADPWVIIGATGIVAMAALAAATVPLRRVTQIDPAVALRRD